MTDRNIVRGLVLIAISLAFGLRAMRYPIGDLSNAGPGLFPLLVSGLLLLIGLSIVVRARFVERVALDIKFKNIGIILGSLCGFVAISQFINMTIGIAFMVFCAAFAGSSYSVVRNIKVAGVLICVAFAFQKFLGLNLPLY